MAKGQTKLLSVAKKRRAEQTCEPPHSPTRPQGGAAPKHQKTMKTNLFVLSILLLLGACRGPKPQNQKEVAAFALAQLDSGRIDCFAPHFDSLEQRWTFCEGSALAYWADHFYLVSDKPLPPNLGSPLLKMEAPLGGKAQYFPTNYLDEVEKLEALAAGPKGLWAMTAFDRLKDDDWAGYNQLWFWKNGEKQPFLVGAETQESSEQKGSLALQKAIKDYLGQPYFKLEGLAEGPEQQLFLGLRALGKSYKEFDYQLRILSLKYDYNAAGMPVLDLNIEELSLDLPAWAKDLPLGLSSLEYRAEEQAFYLVSSMEVEGQALSSYVWRFPYQKGAKKADLVVLQGPQKQPFKVLHKAEGLCFGPKGELYLLFDDDRELLWGRQPHQLDYYRLRY